MKIIFSNSYLTLPSNSAEAVFMVKMAESYGKLGHQVVLSLLKEGAQLDKRRVLDFFEVQDTFDIEYRELSRNRKLLFFDLAFKIPLFMKLKNPDVFHTKNITSAWGACKIFNLPTILELHDSPAGNVKTMKLFQQTIKSRSFLFIIVITHALSNHIRDLIGSKVPIIVLPDAVNQANIDLEITKENARKLLNLNSENPIALYSGQLYEGRGIELIIEIAKILQDYKFLVVGGNEADIRKYKDASLKILNIKFLGHQEQKRLLLFQKAADVLLMPYANKVTVSGIKGGDTSKYASPMKMFEYMAAERPIVSSTLPVLFEILRHNHNALMVDYYKVDEWVNAIRLLINDPNFAQKLASSAKEDVKQYTWEKRAKKIIDFYNSQNVEK